MDPDAGDITLNFLAEFLGTVEVGATGPPDMLRSRNDGRSAVRGHPLSRHSKRSWYSVSHKYADHHAMLPWAPRHAKNADNVISANTRRYLQPGFGYLRCSSRGCFVWLFLRVVALPEQCLRCKLSTNLFVAAIRTADPADSRVQVRTAPPKPSHLRNEALLMRFFHFESRPSAHDGGSREVRATPVVSSL